MIRYIRVQEMLTAMAQTTAAGHPKPFTIGYLTADKQRGTGGDFVVVKASLSTKGRRSGSIEKRMINIVLYSTGEFKSVHLDNILYFNDNPLS